LRPQFNRRIEALAELRLATMALGPLEEQYGKPWPDQVPELALSVWPTALLVDPEQGEVAQAYLQRVCVDELAVDCKHVVPKYWPAMIGAKVWRDLGDRAHEAVGDCDLCDDDETYAKALRSFDQHNADIATVVNEIEAQAHPSRWPVAPLKSAEYSGAPVLSVRKKGRLFFDDEELLGEWRSLLKSKHEGSKIALHLYPEQKVSRLRELLRDLTSIGYSEVALIARSKEYPYVRREVAVAINRKAVSIPLKDSDSIALLVHTLGNL